MAEAREERLRGFEELNARVVVCRKCPRLVEWRERVGREKRAAYRDEEYWARPVPGFGDPWARILVVGLAPAAHGGNRTGRIFTGDRSGDWLFASLYRTGFANQPVSRRRDDGLRLDGMYIAAAVRCAPPDNRPTPTERDNCLPYLVTELDLLRELRVIVVLGGFGYAALARVVRLPRPRPPFGHGAEATATGAPAGDVTVVCSYHPSQQNTFTGRLTEPMFDSVFHRARELAGMDPAPPAPPVPPSG